MITLLNAAPDTGNQGVTALCLSALSGLAARDAGPVAVADHGRGLRPGTWGIEGAQRIGLTHSRRIWRADTLRTVHALIRVGGGFSQTARTIAGSRAILDVSGGDSFTDLYGPKRFRAMVLTKRLALDARRPLILLPQTLGPFVDPRNRAEAARILRAAHAVWVRDAASHAFLQDILGDAFDPDRHRLGVDMAVGLPSADPGDRLCPSVRKWLAEDRDAPVAGLNVSGLLTLEPAAAQIRFGLAQNHPAQIEAAARALLDSDPALRLVLLPHVHRPPTDAESDLGAAWKLQLRLAGDYPGRVRVLDAPLDAMQLKWCLARFDWFAGARMHATIGAFSSGTPTLGLGYSDKAAGVFAECGIGAEVADLRTHDAAALAERVAASYRDRDALRRRLADVLPTLRRRADSQMDMIVAQIAEAQV